MIHYNAYYGIDVHQDTLVIRSQTEKGDFHPFVILPYDDSKILDFFRNEQKVHPCILVAYEAGGCGYHLQRMLLELGIHCIVVAPSRILRSSGNRIKNDKRDAAMLLEQLVDGRLTPVYVPSQADEAVRELTRQRDAMRKRLNQARAQLLSFLRRHGLRFREGKTNWTKIHMKWLGRIQFSESLLQSIYTNYLEEVYDLNQKLDARSQQMAEVLKTWDKHEVVKGIQAFKGLNTLSAMSLVSEIGSFSRFPKAGDIMAYLGLIPSEYSSGQRVCRGRITKTGNSRARRLLIEAAQAARHHPNRSTDLIQKKWEGLPQSICNQAWKAQKRLHRTYWKLLQRGRPHNVAIVAVARELIGFIWAVAVQVETQEVRKKQIA